MSCATLLCLTPLMGCAHMDDHRACRVTSVHTLSTTTKKTENNKCSAVAMWMVRHKHSSRRGWPKLPPPGVLALCQQRTLLNTFKQFVLVLRDPHLLWQHHQAAREAARLKPDMFGSSYELQTIWTGKQFQVKLKKTTCKSCTLKQRTSCYTC